MNKIYIIVLVLTISGCATPSGERYGLDKNDKQPITLSDLGVSENSDWRVNRRLAPYYEGIGSTTLCINVDTSLISYCNFLNKNIEKLHFDFWNRIITLGAVQPKYGSIGGIATAPPSDVSRDGEIHWQCYKGLASNKDRTHKFYNLCSSNFIFDDSSIADRIVGGFNYLVATHYYMATIDLSKIASFVVENKLIELSARKIIAAEGDLKLSPDEIDLAELNKLKELFLFDTYLNPNSVSVTNITSVFDDEIDKIEQNRRLEVRAQRIAIEENERLIKKRGSQVCNQILIGSHNLSQNRGLIGAVVEEYMGDRIKLRISFIRYQRESLEQLNYDGSFIRTGTIIWDNTDNWGTHKCSSYPY